MEPQQPSIGRILHVKGVNSNGTDVQAAMVTRTWGGTVVTSVNLQVFQDAAPVLCLTSVPFVQSRDDAEVCMQRGAMMIAFWPPR